MYSTFKYYNYIDEGFEIGLIYSVNYSFDISYSTFFLINYKISFTFIQNFLIFQHEKQLHQTLL